MTRKGKFTYREIIDQPDAWAEALEVGQGAQSALKRLWRETRAGELLFIGCGSTYYLSLAAAAMARERRLAARAMPSSEAWLFPRLLGDVSRTILVAVSRSAETSETVQAVDAFRKAGGPVAVTVGCYPEASLTRVCDMTLAVPKAQEVSVAQTRSFASMLVACRALVGALSGEDGPLPRLAALPELGRSLIERYGGLAERLGADASIQRFFFLGSGPRYGLACETMLKMKEMSLSYSEAFHTLEFRHGPKSMVDDSSLTIGLLSDEARSQETAVLADMKGLGSSTLALVEAGEGVGADEVIDLGSGLAELDRLVLYLPVLQLLAFRRALANGQDPDNPHNLTQVVTL